MFKITKRGEFVKAWMLEWNQQRDFSPEGWACLMEAVKEVSRENGETVPVWPVGHNQARCATPAFINI